MSKRFITFISLFLISLFAVSCSMPDSAKTEADYKILEQTAAVHITQTFEAMPTATPTFTPVPTNTPEPTATDIPTPTEDLTEYMITRMNEIPTMVPPEPTATIAFPDKAQFISALPSPNQFVPNQHFYLTWQIKNTGTTTWSGKYRFYYSDGIQLADQSSYSISANVEPGAIMTVTMPATAPSAEGTYQTSWTLENPDGIPFYYVYYTTIVGDETYITEVPELNPTSTPSSLDWMCSDAGRSLVQGDGCASYCTVEMVKQMNNNGYDCYVNGERVKYEE